MSTTAIVLNGKNGNVTARITCPRSPQVYLGMVWRYNSDESPDIKSGNYTNDEPDVPLGKAAELDGKLFLIEGVIINHNDPLPSPYEIEVTILQDGRMLKNEVPSDGGKGSLLDKDIAFVYHFKLSTT
ncbi:hypothetical protein GCM10022246_01000 [Pedobacter ginsengiterrae]|uniref:Uncharacterized protein n=1 Tax=Pedobacter ginsengiterrae TaxID=871696 RepID=A0ABP7NM95_9SPHI